MSRDDAVELIRAAFAHVEVKRVVVEFDPLMAAEVARVAVGADQLTEALGENGVHARRAAAQSGLSVEVVLADG